MLLSCPSQLGSGPKFTTRQIAACSNYALEAPGDRQSLREAMPKDNDSRAASPGAGCSWTAGNDHLTRSTGASPPTAPRKGLIICSRQRQVGTPAVVERRRLTEMAAVIANGIAFVFPHIIVLG